VPRETFVGNSRSLGQFFFGFPPTTRSILEIFLATFLPSPKKDKPVCIWAVRDPFLRNIARVGAAGKVDLMLCVCVGRSKPLGQIELNQS